MEHKLVGWITDRCGHQTRRERRHDVELGHACSQVLHQRSAASRVLILGEGGLTLPAEDWTASAMKCDYSAIVWSSCRRRSGWDSDNTSDEQYPITVH
jgi:hypothetical protein